MFKALLKKQFMELNAGNLNSKKKKKKSASSPFARLAFIYIFIAAAAGFAFFMLSSLFAEAFLTSGIESLCWLFFAFIGIGALLFGAFGSVFHTYSALYKAKDNELLLSMPIPPRMILIVRIAGVYVMSLFYSAICWIPAVIRYAQYIKPSPAVTLGAVLLLLPAAMLVTVFTCIAGWVVAMVSGKLRNRSFVTVIIGVVFFGLYYFVCFRLYDIVQKIAADAENIGEGIKIWAYPVSQLAYGAMGSLTSGLIFTAISAVAFAICCFVLSKTFIKITTLNKGVKKAVYVESRAKEAGTKSALFRRELKHFTSNASYMMNCGLGLVMVLAVAVIVLINTGNIRPLLGYLQETDPVLYRLIPVFATAFICLLNSMVYITAPSVSLEGKAIWIAQSLPVKTLDILYAKEKVHIILGTIPAAISAVVIGAVIQLNAPEYILSVLNAVLFVVFCAGFGLMLNLKKPDLNWTNENQPIKSGMPAVVSLFGGWAICIGAGAAYFFLAEFVLPVVYLGITAALLVLVILLNDRWIRKKGTVIFRGL